MSLPAGDAPSGIERATGEQNGDILTTFSQQSIPMEEMETETELANIPVEARNWPKVTFLWICGISIFLAPVIIVSGMTANHGDGWKLLFFGYPSFSLPHFAGLVALTY
jgi:hypothetical protein